MIRLASLALSSNRAALAGPPSLARGSAAEVRLRWLEFHGRKPQMAQKRWQWPDSLATDSGLADRRDGAVLMPSAVGVHHRGGPGRRRPTVISELAVADDRRAGRPPAGLLRESYRGRHPKQQMRPRARLRPGAAQDLVAESAPGHSNVSAANEIAGSQTGSQRPQAQGCARPPPAIPAAVERHVRPRPAPSRHTSKVPPKQ